MFYFLHLFNNLLTYLLTYLLQVHTGSINQYDTVAKDVNVNNRTQTHRCITVRNSTRNRGRQMRFYKAVVTTWIRPPFDFHSTTIRPRYDHSTTYFMTAGLCVWAPALRRKEIASQRPVLHPCDLNETWISSRTAVESKSNRSCNHRIRQPAERQQQR